MPAFAGMTISFNFPRNLCAFGDSRKALPKIKKSAAKAALFGEDAINHLS